jgi:hypothetical protein
MAAHLPEASLADGKGLVRLAVLTGERLTLLAALHPHATLTVAQPATAILSQQWMFAHGRLTSIQLEGGRADVGRQ